MLVELGARVGRCNHHLLQLHALAFAMGTHTRLDSADNTACTVDTTCCAYASMPGDLVRRVVEACVSWPEGQAGKLEGVVRLLGGGVKKVRVST
mmetsp:Transcript_1036/g.1328  ORF Transcript_1036/g.1328 Transcript_1036/m.1328 type:complete len:94 (-) Transcript_1036:224-505(-)